MARLEVGNKPGESCTVVVSTTKCNGFTFLDGPGFNDTGGATKDVANAVALHSVMKRVPSMIPVLFIEHGHFSLSHGQGIRDLIQGFSAIYDNETALLVKHMVVVFTKVPDGLELRHIAKDIQGIITSLRAFSFQMFENLILVGIKDAENAVGNTDEVLDILDAMYYGCLGKKSMARKLLIFRPLDTESQEEFIDLFKSSRCKPLENPFEIFQVRLQPNTTAHLDASLHQLKQQIPIWLKDKETGKVVEQMRLLHKLSSTIPPVKSTLEFCSSNVYTSLVEKIGDAKTLHFPPLLKEGNKDVYLTRFLTTREMLDSIEDLRQFMGDIEPLKTFDEWTEIQIKLFADKIKEEKDFDKICAGLKIMENLDKPQAFGYLKSVGSYSNDLKSWVQNKVGDLQEKVENGSTKLSKKSIETLLVDLQSLQQASVLQPYVSFDCAACLQKAIQTINKNMDQMVSRVAEYIGGQPSPPVSEEMISDFQIIRAVCEHQALSAFLNPVASETEKQNQYQQLKAKCRESASRVLDQLLHLSNSQSALEGTNESVILRAKAMGEFDWEVKNYVEVELTKCILSFDARVDEIMELLKQEIFYRSSGPNYASVPLLFRRLDSCEWLDNYTHGGNRIQTKKSEAVASLDTSLKSLVQRIKNGWKRSKLDDVAQHFETLDSLDNIENLALYLPSLQEYKNEAADFLQEQIRSKFDYGNTKLAAKENTGGGLSNSQEVVTPFTLSDADHYLGALAKLVPIAELVGGVDSEIKRLQDKIKQSLRSQGDEKVRRVQSDEFKFSEYGEWLDDFQRVEDRKEYPHLPSELRIYGKVKSSCLTRVEQLSKQVVNLCQSGELERVPELLQILEGATRLQFHIPTITTIISEAQSASASTSKNTLDDVKQAFADGKYYDCVNYVQNLPEGQRLRTECIRFITHSLQSMVAIIKSSISLSVLKDDEKWRELLQKNISFENSVQTALKGIFPEDSTFFSDAITGIYRTFDSKFTEELRSFHDSSFPNESNQQQIALIEKLMRSVSTNPKRLPDCIKEVETLKTGLEDAFSALEKHIEDLEGNDGMVDSLYSSLPQGQKKSLCLNSIRKKIMQYSSDACNAKTAEEAQRKLDLLKNLSTTFNDKELQSLANAEYATASRRIEEADKKREGDFQEVLGRWNIEDIANWLDRYSHDAILIADCKKNLKTQAAKKTPEPLRLDASETDIIRFGEQLGIFMQIHTEFPWAISDADVKTQKNRIEACFQNKSSDLGSFQGSPSSLDVSKFANIIRQILAIKSLDRAIGFNLIPEADFAKLLHPCCQFFSKTQDDLEACMARNDYSGLHKTLQLFHSIDPLFQSLKSFLEKNQSDGVGPLATIINRFSGNTKAMSQSQEWLQNTKFQLQSYWDKKEFHFVERALRNIFNKTYLPLGSLFPDINTWVTEAQEEIIFRYNQLAENTEKNLGKEEWKLFREQYDLLQKLTDVEALLGKKRSEAIYRRLQDSIEVMEKCHDVTDALCGLNKLGHDIPQVKDRVDVACQKILSTIASKPKGGDDIYELGKALERMTGPRAKNAQDIVGSFKVFAAVNHEIWQQKTKGQDINWALGSDEKGPRFVYSQVSQKTSSGLTWAFDALASFCKGETSQKAQWKKMHEAFESEFKRLYEKSIEDIVSGVIGQIKSSRSYKVLKQDQVPIIAGICVVWSKLKSGSIQCNSSSKTSVRLIPHPIQALCFFRLLEQDPNTNEYYSQLIEVLTGEGKSVVLGVVAAYFALLKYEVYSICYSEYLSKRDYNDFSELFIAFNISDQIQYSTISAMCETILNKEGNVRQLTKLVIESASNPNSQNPSIPKPRPKVLLIDEVDTFFGPDFYGNTYNPASVISNQDIFEVLKYIFSNKNINFNSVSQTHSYMALINTFPKLKPLINHEINKMLKDATDFENTPERPVVMNGLICYKEQDGMTSNKVYGYKTAFQYLQKIQTGEVKEEQAKDRLGLYIGCGNFSFAEIPKMDFAVKLGVSGTLRSLTEQEKKIIESYGIQRLAFAPSIYGSSRLNEKSEIPGVSPIKIAKDKSEWFLRIAQNAQDKQQRGRAVLIFFHSRDTLNEFQNSQSLSNLPILHEEESFKEPIIKESTVSGTITLCTRPFGRGVDFICRDPITKGADGVHIIQTFVADSEAEQIQIKGRAARQGDPGSHEYILSYDNLVTYLGPKEGQPDHSGFKDFTHDSALSLVDLGKKITQLRDELYLVRVAELETKRNDALVAHNLTSQFHQALIAYDSTEASRDKITTLIMNINQGAIAQATSNYHLFFCLDESGSMDGDEWDQLIKAVAVFITKRIDMCNQNGVNVQDVVTVVTYSHTARVQLRSQPLTAGLESRIKFGSGGTDFAQGLNVVEQEMKTTLGGGFVPCLLFMSDGGCHNGENEMKRIRQTFPQAKIFVVGFGSGCDRNKLTGLAKEGQGEYFFGADGPALAAEFSAISVKISGGTMAL